jgi:hypothetical protein
VIPLGLLGLLGLLCQDYGIGVMVSARHLAWMTLMDIYRGAYADVALHNHLRKTPLQENDRVLRDSIE